MTILANNQFQGVHTFGPDVTQSMATIIGHDLRPTNVPDDKGNIRSWQVWQDAEASMLAAGWPQDVIQWFYKQRYEAAFGAREVGQVRQQNFAVQQPREATIKSSAKTTSAKIHPIKVRTMSQGK
jgi:hypothetical protein